MGNGEGEELGGVVDLGAYRRQRADSRAAKEHARAIALFECAAALARQRHSGLLKLIEEVFGSGFLEDRVHKTLFPESWTKGKLTPR